MTKQVTHDAELYFYEGSEYERWARYAGAIVRQKGISGVEQDDLVQEVLLRMTRSYGSTWATTKPHDEVRKLLAQTVLTAVADDRRRRFGRGKTKRLPVIFDSKRIDDAFSEGASARGLKDGERLAFAAFLDELEHSAGKAVADVLGTWIACQGNYLATADQLKMEVAQVRAAVSLAGRCLKAFVND